MGFKIFQLRRRGHAQSKASQKPTTLEPGSYSKGQYTQETIDPSEGELLEMTEMRGMTNVRNVIVMT